MNPPMVLSVLPPGAPSENPTGVCSKKFTAVLSVNSLEFPFEIFKDFLLGIPFFKSSLWEFSCSCF